MNSTFLSFLFLPFFISNDFYIKKYVSNYVKTSLGMSATTRSSPGSSQPRCVSQLLSTELTVEILFSQVAGGRWVFAGSGGSLGFARSLARVAFSGRITGNSVPHFCHCHCSCLFLNSSEVARLLGKNWSWLGRSLVSGDLWNR